MTQEDIRQRLKDLHSTYGISYRFMASQFGISVSLLSKFINGVRNLGEDNYQKTLAFIQKGGEMVC